MASSTRDGGPAFPALDVEHFPAGYGHGEHSEVTGQKGMSLRDYFAGQALAALIAKSPLKCSHGGDSLTDTIEANVTGAYLYADAMLKAREAQ